MIQTPVLLDGVAEFQRRENAVLRLWQEGCVLDLEIPTGALPTQLQTIFTPLC